MANVERLLKQQNTTLEHILAGINAMRRERGLGELEQAPEDINWRVFWSFIFKANQMQPKKPIDILLREMVEIGILNPQTVVPVAAKPFKVTFRRVPVEGSLEPGTGTGTGTGEETGTGTGEETGTGTGTGEPVPPVPPVPPVDPPQF